MIAQTSPCSRADVNRANSQHSTGPSSSIGKARSSQNSFKHGLYSQDLIIQGEDPAEFDHLRATLRDEHEPANTTEEILVDELAQHFWRMRRFRELEARAWTPENLDSWIVNGMLALINRSMASAERSFHKTLTALQKLQASRGFVPSKMEPELSHIRLIDPEEDDPEENICLSGFVPQKTAAELAAFEYMGYFPEDHDEYVESIVDSRLHPRHDTETAT